MGLINPIREEINKLVREICNLDATEHALSYIERGELIGIEILDTKTPLHVGNFHEIVIDKTDKVPHLILLNYAIVRSDFERSSYQMVFGDVLGARYGRPNLPPRYYPSVYGRPKIVRGEEEIDKTLRKYRFGIKDYNKLLRLKNQHNQILYAKSVLRRNP